MVAEEKGFVQIKAADNAERLDNKIRDLYWWRGLAHRAQDEFQEALQDYQKALQLPSTAKDYQKLMHLLKVSSWVAHWNRQIARELAGLILNLYRRGILCGGKEGECQGCNCPCSVLYSITDIQMSKNLPLAWHLASFSYQEDIISNNNYAYWKQLLAHGLQCDCVSHISCRGYFILFLYRSIEI